MTEAREDEAAVDVTDLAAPARRDRRVLSRHQDLGALEGVLVSDELAAPSLECFCVRGIERIRRLRSLPRLEGEQVLPEPTADGPVEPTAVRRAAEAVRSRDVRRVTLRDQAVRVLAADLCERGGA